MVEAAVKLARIWCGLYISVSYYCFNVYSVFFVFDFHPRLLSWCAISVAFIIASGRTGHVWKNKQFPSRTGYFCSYYFHRFIMFFITSSLSFGPQTPAASKLKISLRNINLQFSKCLRIPVEACLNESTKVLSPPSAAPNKGQRLYQN